MSAASPIQVLSTKNQVTGHLRDTDNAQSITLGIEEISLL